MPGADLGHTAAEIQRLLGGIDDARLDGATPCEGLKLRALLAHLVGLTKAFTDTANKAPQDPAAMVGAALDAELDPEWRTLLPQQLDELVAAWRNPAAWEGMATAGGVTMPAE